MARLFQTSIEINHQKVAQIVSKHWNLNLGKFIKASQNHTFQAFNKSQINKIKYSVRVIPDPQQKKVQRVQDEICFVKYLADHKLNHICAPIKLIDSQNYYLYQQQMLITIFQWARGQPNQFGNLLWMTTQRIVHSWGRFFAQMHKLSKQFQKQNPLVAKRIQNWDQVHCGILKGIQLHPQDQNVLKDQQEFGIIHGDLNWGNFCYVKEDEHIQVFDTDQVQRGLFLWDVSHAIFTVYMIQFGGMPVSGKIVPQANTELFKKWIVEGYQQVTGKGSVNIDRLNRMLQMDRQYYVKFSKQALKQGNVPPMMKPFCEYVVEKFENHKKQ